MLEKIFLLLLLTMAAIGIIATCKFVIECCKIVMYHYKMRKIIRSRVAYF